MIYVGIDPGNKGAIVAIDHHRMVVGQWRMPLVNVGKGKANKYILDMPGVLKILRQITYEACHTEPQPMYVVLEKAQVMGSGGPTPASARSMFGYGRAFGALEMALFALQIPFEVVHPRTWGGKILKGIEGSDTKARAILRVQRSLPRVDLTPGQVRKPHDGLADAACMCLYAMLLRPVAGVAPVSEPTLPPPARHPLPPGPPAPPRRVPPPPPPRKP